MAVGLTTSTREFACLGLHERCRAQWVLPDRYRAIETLRQARKLIAQGSGLSLAGASFGAGSLVVNMRRFSRLLEFDADNQTVLAEAGITLGELYAFLTPKGLQVPVQPGYPDITLGGCIAANVHGKNQYREGVFSDHVEEIRLYHPSHGEMVLSRDRDAALLELTCGGLGLTGIIIAARIAVKPLQGHRAVIERTSVSGLVETVETMVREQDRFDVLYSWHDLATFGPRLGEGFVVRGTVRDGDARPAAPPRIRPLHSTAGAGWPRLFNAASLRLANFAYNRLNRHRTTATDMFSLLFPFAALPEYFKAYGRRGFLEHQALVPSTQVERYVEDLEALLRKHRVPFGLASLKLFRGDPNLLWYRGDGVSFGFHLPNGARSLALLAELDRLNLAVGAITNLIKDPRVSAEAARDQYAGYDAFRRRLREFDPDRLFASRLSERLGL